MYNKYAKLIYELVLIHFSKLIFLEIINRTGFTHADSSDFMNPHFKQE